MGLAPLQGVLSPPSSPMGEREGQQSVAGGGFTAARFSHQTKGFTFLEMETYPINRFYYTPSCIKVGPQVSDLIMLIALRY